MDNVKAPRAAVDVELLAQAMQVAHDDGNGYIPRGWDILSEKAKEAFRGDARRFLAALEAK